MKFIGWQMLPSVPPMIDKEDKEDMHKFPVDVWFFNEIVKQGKFYFTKKGGMHSGKR